MNARILPWMGCHPRAAAAILAGGAGALILLLSAAGIYPAQALARLFSDDGTLTETYAGLIRTGQIKLGVAFLLAAALAGWVDARRIVRSVREWPFGSIALGTGLMALLLSYAVQEKLFEGIPHVTDATSHLFQAKIFAAGRLYAPVPPCPDAFWQPNVVMTTAGKWFTKYTPGQALLLAAGLRLGILPWVLPLCLALTVVLLGRMLEDHAGKSEARAFMGMFALSPLALLLGGSYMSHVPALALAAAGLFFWLKSRSAEGPLRGAALQILAGFFLAFSALVRPVEFVLMGMIGCLFFLAAPRADWRWLFKSLPALIAGALPVAVVWGGWNLALYGDPLAIGYGFTTADVRRASFQGHFGFSETFGVRAAFVQLVANLDRFNRAMLGFPSSLLLVPFAFLRMRRRLTWLAAAGIAVVVGVYFFYEYRPEFEARYGYLALPCFIYLAVAGLKNVVALGAARPWNAVVGQAAWLGLVAFYLHGAGSYWPDYLVPSYGHGYEDCSPALQRQVAARGIADAVVLVTPPGGFAYSSGFIHLDPFLRNGVIYARGDVRSAECLENAFPEKAFYRFDAQTGELAPWRQPAAKIHSPEPSGRHNALAKSVRETP
ncbi:MAG: hypothetical protein AB7V14_07425 [Kiritimatiellia bacterium]